jgi:hypothetical protein
MPGALDTPVVETKDAGRLSASQTPATGAWKARSGLRGVSPPPNFDSGTSALSRIPVALNWTLICFLYPVNFSSSSVGVTHDTVVVRPHATVTVVADLGLRVEETRDRFINQQLERLGGRTRQPVSIPLGSPLRHIILNYTNDTPAPRLPSTTTLLSATTFSWIAQLADITQGPRQVLAESSRRSLSRPSSGSPSSPEIGRRALNNTAGDLADLDDLDGTDSTASFKGRHAR